jgi:hypothetical protein
MFQVFGCWKSYLGTETEPKAEFDIDAKLIKKNKIKGYKEQSQYTSAYFLKTIDTA